MTVTSFDSLDEFIAPRIKDLRMFPRNAYVRHPGWKSLYVRVSQRFIEKTLRVVIDLAKIEAKKKGKGTFRNLIAHLQEHYADCPIYVEQVQTPRFEEGLLRLGFKRTNETEPSFYLLPVANLSMLHPNS